MIKKYVFDYDLGKAEACIQIDTSKYTKEMALETLNFFTWSWDKTSNPIDEVAKKYALEAIKLATFNNHNTYGVKSDFKLLEGFQKVDGSFGIELTHVEGFEFDEDDITFSINH